MRLSTCQKYGIILALLSVPFLPCVVSFFEGIFFGTCVFDRFIRGVFGIDVYYYVNVFPLEKLRLILGV